MIHKDKIKFEKECEEIIKPIMRKLYIEWSNIYEPATIHQQFCFYVFKRNHKKILELTNKRKHRKLNNKKLKEQVEALQVQEEINNFVDQLGI